MSSRQGLDLRAHDPHSLHRGVKCVLFFSTDGQLSGGSRLGTRPFLFFGGADRIHAPRRSFLIIFRIFFLCTLWEYSDPRLLCTYGSG
jgi:hypothetical protein